MKALKFYQDNIEKSKSEIDKIQKKSILIGWSRFVIFILIVISIYKGYTMNNPGIMVGLGGAFIILFLVVIGIHSKILNQKKKFKLMIEINEKGIRRLNGEFKNEEDKGIEYIDEKHPYTNDLDIFGDNSLFQLINTTVTKAGREALAKILSRNTISSAEEIKKKQEAIDELGKKPKWRQSLILKGMMRVSNSEEEVNELQYLSEWSHGKVKPSAYKKVIAYFFIAITFIALALIVLGMLRGTYIILVLMVNFVVIRILTKDDREDLNMFGMIKQTIKSYAEILEHIEDEEVKSEYLKEIKSKIQENEKSCKKEMKRLSKMLDWVGDSNGNAFYLIINLFIYSDVFLVANLESWKKKNGEELDKWIEALGEFDALSSVGNLPFDFDEWEYPEVVEEKIVRGTDIGHPILGERAIKNNYTLNENTKVTLITGSNMSGKSTFLRTIGLNLVLSYLGAPVSAKEFKCGMFDLYTCMRTKDNLQESISSFYAEILRIKLLIEGAKEGKRIFFLLDEIFKGTNSEDRHTGAKVLINQLIDAGAVGLVSTHDFDLCDLEKVDNRIKNQNFREYYEDDKIKFDYKLREGRSTTQNAIHLMKLAGIDFKEKE